MLRASLEACGGFLWGACNVVATYRVSLKVARRLFAARDFLIFARLFSGYVGLSSVALARALDCPEAAIVSCWLTTCLPLYAYIWTSRSSEYARLYLASDAVALSSFLYDVSALERPVAACLRFSAVRVLGDTAVVGIYAYREL